MVDGLIAVARRGTLRRVVHVTKTNRRRSNGVCWLVFIACCVTHCCFVGSAPLPSRLPLPLAPHHSPPGGRFMMPLSVASSREWFPSEILPFPERPKWVNPCGGVVLDDTIDASPPTDAEIARNAILDVQLALRSVHQFKDNFVQSVFKMDFDQVTSTWSHVRYDWLPSNVIVPKLVGDVVSPAHLYSLQLGEVLKRLFLASQTLAVGMEQVILDRAVYGGDFLEEFANMENKLGMVLCSLQLGLMEKQVKPDTDAARQLMSNEYRDMKSSSGRNLRDFIILRDYINLLEYLLQILQHFQGSS